MRSFLPAVLVVLSLAAATWADQPTAVPEPSPQAAKRVADVMARLDGFELGLVYYGPQDKPYYQVTLAVRADAQAGEPFRARVSIDKETAARLVRWLEQQGFFERAVDDVQQDITLRAPAGPTYWLTVQADDPQLGRVGWHEDLGWNLAMLGRIKSLREAAGETAQKPLDMLLGRLEGHRREWLQKSPPKSQ